MKGRVAARFWDIDDQLIYETELEAQALEVLARAGEVGTLAAMAETESHIERTLGH